jgi:hypothetical protein
MSASAILQWLVQPLDDEQKSAAFVLGSQSIESAMPSHAASSAELARSIEPSWIAISVQDPSASAVAARIVAAGC